MEYLANSNLRYDTRKLSNEHSSQVNPMAYVFDPISRTVADASRSISIKHVYNGAGIGERKIFHFVSPEVSFFFYAKINDENPSPGKLLSDHWSIDGLPLEFKNMRKGFPGPITVPQPLLANSFSEICEALKEVPLSVSGIAMQPGGQPVRKVEFDLRR